MAHIDAIHRPAAAPSSAPLGLVVPFCLTWSSAFAVGKLGLADCPPLLLLAIRFLLAGVILVAVAAVMGQLRGLSARAWAVLAGLGVLNHALYLGLSFSGMTLVSSGLTAIIVSSTPVLVAAVASVALNEPMTARKALGLTLGVVGVAIVVRGRLGTAADDPAGIGLVLGALVALTAGTLLFKRYAPRTGLAAGGGIQVLAGGLALVPASLLVEGAPDIRLTSGLALSLGYLVLVVSIGAHLLWFRILQRTTATEASAYHFLMPPLGLLFGWMILGEAVQVWDLLGIVPVAAGIRLVTRP